MPVAHPYRTGTSSQKHREMEDSLSGWDQFVDVTKNNYGERGRRGKIEHGGGRAAVEAFVGPVGHTHGVFLVHGD